MDMIPRRRRRCPHYKMQCRWATFISYTENLAYSSNYPQNRKSVKVSSLLVKFNALVCLPHFITISTSINVLTICRLMFYNTRRWIILNATGTTVTTFCDTIPYQSLIFGVSHCIPDLRYWGPVLYFSISIPSLSDILFRTPLLSPTW